MTPDPTTTRYREALESILKTARDHPCFDVDAYVERDICYLVQQGGDIYAWTMIAITANDALKPCNAESDVDKFGKYKFVMESLDVDCEPKLL